jgi:glycine cleavage system H protein
LGDHDIPSTLRFTKDDEWVRAAGDRVTIGVTDFAQQQLGDVVFVELPELGKTFERGEPFGVIESVKAVADLYAPLSGEVVEVNADLTERPESVNEDCYGEGWMIVLAVADASELDQLLGAEEYAVSVREREANG